LNNPSSESTSVPTISIIVPVYNSADCISACLSGVIAQTNRDWELLLMDDGSTDATAAWIDREAGADARIRPFHLSHRGPGAARNAGLTASRGKFIVFLDVDDVLSPEALERWLLAGDRPGIDMVAGGFLVMDRKSNTLIRKETPLPDAADLSRSEFLHYLEGYLHHPNRTPLFSYVWGKMYRAERIRRHQLVFDETMQVFEDTEFNFHFLHYAERIAYVKERLYAYTTGYLSPTTGGKHFRHKLFDPLKALERLSGLFIPSCHPGPVEAVIGHAVITLIIIQTIRLCGQMTTADRRRVRTALRVMTDDPRVRRSLSYYRPGPGESRLFPWLIRGKMISVMMALGRYKAEKRYGKLWQKT